MVGKSGRFANLFHFGIVHRYGVELFACNASNNVERKTETFVEGRDDVANGKHYGTRVEDLTLCLGSAKRDFALGLVGTNALKHLADDSVLIRRLLRSSRALLCFEHFQFALGVVVLDFSGLTCFCRFSCCILCLSLAHQSDKFVFLHNRL